MDMRFLRHLTLTFAFFISLMAHADPIAEQMRINQKRYGIAGQALLIAHNDTVLFRAADGVKIDNVFPVYSLSKLLVSTLIMQLVEQSKIDLDQPASIYVRDLPASWRGITVRQFVNHSSGVPEYFENTVNFLPTAQAVLASLAAKPLNFQPGTSTRYTQTNYLVLTMLLEAQYGKPYAQIAKQRILEPLHMEHTYLGAPSLPKAGVLTAYAGKDGKLIQAEDVAWPDYSYGHAELYLTVDDLFRFVQAVAKGELVSKQTLLQLWQPPLLSTGRPGIFATGWEYGESGQYHHVGHDGGTRVRVRLVYKDTLDGDNYIFIYLTNGSVKNVWSRVLLDSAMAAADPDQFRQEVLSEKLIAYALGETKTPTVEGIPDLERFINASGYAARENLGLNEAIRVFTLNTTLFPDSANTWDSLAETYQAKGDQVKARQLYEKAHLLSAKSGASK
ncbi:serine hydrolase [Duganella sp. FT134W]|uniref:Serine hydrolase n=2 Tax=Duganella margarita TaxID=2692170 RepID=A0A7X4H2X7_9BURK|nr:serine hydrolase [Duganella margarita]